MNNFFAQRLSFLLILAASTVVGSGLSAQAQTIDTGSTDSRANSEEITKLSVSVVELADSSTAPVIAPSQASSAATVSAADTQSTLQEAVPAIPESEQAQVVSPTEQQLPQTTATEERATSSSVPVPGTTATSAATLSPESPLTPQRIEPTSEKTTPKKVAQTDINPGGATRGGSSYVGIGANFGITGGRALGDTNFTVISKIGLLNAISARPSVVVGDDTTFLIPVTYDVGPLPIPVLSNTIAISPYLGGGVAVATNGNVGPMITAGVDVPVARQFTATAAVNVGFLKDTNVGILVGVGYNFSGLFGL